MMINISYPICSASCSFSPYLHGLCLFLTSSHAHYIPPLQCRMINMYLTQSQLTDKQIPRPVQMTKSSMIMTSYITPTQTNMSTLIHLLLPLQISQKGWYSIFFFLFLLLDNLFLNSHGLCS